MSYFLQPTGCGGRVIEAKVEDYLARYDVPAREETDVRWAQTCMDLEDVVEPLDAACIGVVASDFPGTEQPAAAVAGVERHGTAGTSEKGLAA